MIVASEVSKSFGPVHAVRGISFEIPAGQVVGLLGPNGAGKTTTIRMITGFSPPTRGSVAVCGHDTVTDSLAARRHIGYLPEATPLYPEMRVADYLAHRATLYKLSRTDRRQAISRHVDLCELGTVLRRRIGHLSKGFKQRVGLAASLLHDPAVLILDEPTSGLDPEQRTHARQLIRDLSEDRTVLVSSHVLPEVEKTCDRVIIIANGRLRADGSPKELSASAGNGGGPSVELELAIGDERRTDAERALASVSGVRAVEQLTHAAGSIRYRIVMSSDCRSRVVDACVGAGLGVVELTSPRANLERLFLRIINEPEETETSDAAEGTA